MSAPPWGEPVRGTDWRAFDGREPEPRRVSVIVAHYEQPEALDRMLRALRRQTHPAHLVEIVVADDGSATPPVVPDDVVLVTQPDEGFRLAASRNNGARAATGDVLCFLDVDTIPEPGYLAAMARLPSIAPEVVTVGTRRHVDLAALPADEPIEVAAPPHALPEPQWLADEYARTEHLRRADDRSYRFVIGAVVACSRWFFEQTGGFDESFTAYGGEDWEWASRAWRLGAAFAHVPDAVAWHDGGDFATRDAPQSQKDAETTALAMAIPVAGSRPRGIRTARADVHVVVPESFAERDALLTVDAVLAALPEALVAVGARDVPLFRADARIVAALPDGDVPSRVVEVVAPFRVRTAAGATEAFRAAIAEAGSGTVGSVHLADADGTLCVVRSTRGAARAERWGAARCGLDEHRHDAEPMLRRITARDGIAAHFGGWMD